MAGKRKKITKPVKKTVTVLPDTREAIQQFRDKKLSKGELVTSDDVHQCVKG